MLACGCGIVAIIPAFQAGDESSILSTRTRNYIQLWIQVKSTKEYWSMGTP